LKDEKEKWLKETGYGDMDNYGAFTFIIRIGDYGAMNRFMFTEVRSTPLEVLKEIHADFIERAERKEIF
jgi:hypothetical protein